MPRRRLTASEKTVMQKARIESRRERAAALDLLTTNSQFTNPKFWKSVDPDLTADVETAIAKAREAAKRKRIAQLEAELKSLRGQ